MNSKIVNVKVQYIRPQYDNLKEWMENPSKYTEGIFTYIGRRGIVFIDGVRYPSKDSIFANPYKIDKKLDEKSARIEDYQFRKALLFFTNPNR